MSEIELTPDEQAKVDRKFDEAYRWYEKHLKIRDKSARVIPLRLNKTQRALERYKAECEVLGIPCYVLCLKARQEGISTWSQAMFFRDARRFTHRRHIVVAHTDPASRNLFNMSKFFLDHYPTELEADRSSAKELKFTDTKCEYAVQTAGSGGAAGRSFTFNGAHFSEVDQWTDPVGFYGGMMHTIPDTPSTVIVIESTADGPMLFLNQLWDQAIEGRSEYKPFFFPWFVHEEYSRPVSWEDMKYAPREWLNHNRRWVESQRQYEERQRALGKLPRGTRGADTAPGHPGRSAEGDGPSALTGGPESRGETESQRREREGGDRSLGEPAGRQDAGAGTRPGGHLPSLFGERQDDRGDGGSETGAGGRQLRAIRRDNPRDPFYDSCADNAGRRFDGEGKAGFANQIGNRHFGVEVVFLDSLTDYEKGLVKEFDLTNDQLNWRRWYLENRCKGDEVRMRREMPARPEEAFEASGSDILDPHVLAMWTRYAKDNPPEARGSMIARENRPGNLVVSFDSEDKAGKIEIYEYPDPHCTYVMGLDPSQGIEGGDWTVAFVMEVESGNQVAEFRATIDPDLAVGQIEALSIYYNRALVAIEMNGGYGVPYMRHLQDRGTVPMYQREVYDRMVKAYTKSPGWLTTMKTRPMMITEMKEMVRRKRCQVRSLDTLSELRTLWENRKEGSAIGKVEARPGYHDDGAFAYVITGIMRNKVLGETSEKQEQELKQNNIILQLDRRLRRMQREEQPKISSRLPIKPKYVRPMTIKPDGRRSYI